MRLGTQECNQALLKYRKEIECDDIDNLVIDILLSIEDFRYLTLIDIFLSKHDENEHSKILDKINKRIYDIYEELGIEVLVNIPNNRRIDNYRYCLINYINSYTDKILKDDKVTISIENYCTMIEALVKGFNKGYTKTLKRDE